MKIFLIILNLFLAYGVYLSFAQWFTSSGNAEKMEVVKRDNTAVVPVKRQSMPKPEKAFDTSAAVSMVVARNIFDINRCPSAGNFRAIRNAQLQLVGVFQVGNALGAIIMEKAAGNRNNMFNNFRNWRNSNNSNSLNRQSTSNQRKSINTFGEAAPEVRSAVRQYYRIGDVLSNGYTLTEVETNRAVLSRGSSKMELALEDASVNQPKAASKPRKSNPIQNLLNAQTTQVQQQQQLMQMMGMMMRQNFQNNRVPTGGGTQQVSGGSRRTSTRSVGVSSSGSSSNSR